MGLPKLSRQKSNNSYPSGPWSVEIGADHIALYDGDEELVYWTQGEWEEDPTLVISIANAIRILYEEGPDAIRARLPIH